MFSKAYFVRAYYDKLTGNGLLWYAFTNELYRIPTFEEDYQSFIDLSKRNADTIGWIDFENGEYYQDFMQSNGFRVNPETKEIEFSYPDPNATEPQEPVYQKPLTEQIEELENKLKTPDDKYKELDLNTATLEEVRTAKINQLKYLCSQAIYAGFTSSVNGYVFGYNEHDQSNFEKQTALLNLWYNQLNAGKITQEQFNANFPIKWKTKNHGIVDLTEEEYLQVIEDAKAHQLSKQIKYWQLEAQVLAATTKEEIDAIVW
jgi:hypothetical protein